MNLRLLYLVHSFGLMTRAINSRESARTTLALVKMLTGLNCYYCCFVIIFFIVVVIIYSGITINLLLLLSHYYYYK